VVAKDPRWDNVVVVDHPLVQHKLSILRDVGTGAKEFRELVKELAMLEAYEATRSFQLAETVVRTPIMQTTTYVLAGKKVAVIPILRAASAWWRASSNSSLRPRWATSVSTEILGRCSLSSITASFPRTSASATS